MRFCKVDVLQKLHIVMSTQQHTRFQTSTFPKWKMPHLLLQSLTDFLLLLLWNVQNYLLTPTEWTTRANNNLILEGGKLWFYPLERDWSPFCCHGNVTVDIASHSMELCDESNNCTKFFSSIQKTPSEMLHLLWFYTILRPHWHHKSPNLYKSKPWITRQPKVLSQKNKCHSLLLWKLFWIS